MGMLKVKRKDLEGNALPLRPVSNGLRNGAPSGAEIEYPQGGSTPSPEPRIQVVRQPSHPSQPAIDPIKVGKALVDRLGAPYPLIEPFLSVDAPRQPPALSSGDDRAPLPRRLCSPIFPRTCATRDLDPTPPRPFEALVVLLTSPLLEVKGGDLKSHIEKIRIGGGGFVIPGAGGRQLGGSGGRVQGAP